MAAAFRTVLLLLGLGFGLALAPTVARAELTVAIDLTEQAMTVSEDGQVKHRWAISSGRIGYRTPNGSYRPQRLERMHYSRKYDWSPMPHSIFFRGGYAIHGTGAVGRLGRTASHGCIRLAPGNAARLFKLVQEHGAGRTRIVVTGNANIADARAGAPRRAAIRTRIAEDRETPLRTRPAPRVREEAIAPYRPAPAPVASMRRRDAPVVYVYEYGPYGAPLGYAPVYEAGPAYYPYRLR